MRTERARMLAIAGLLAACGGTEVGGTDELLQALPERDEVIVAVPGEATAALLGGPADFYTISYYQARELNGLARHVLRVIEAITRSPPSSHTGDRAVWGPFSARGEPNEHKLTIERRRSPRLHYVWVVEGRHSGLAGAFTALAAGAFEPQRAPSGRGWMRIDFDAIRALNPAESGRGAITYAYARGLGRAGVLAHWEDASAGASAGYAFHTNPDGSGMVLFAYDADIHASGPDAAGNQAQESLLLRTRWIASGEGRADVFATAGDLGASRAVATQCWDGRFISAYESTSIDGAVLGEDGDPTACVFGAFEAPDASELPAGGDVANPYQ